MADTDTETLPNGNATLSAEEEERLKQRPADIDADVREMERRKRVEALMSSRLFREELERVLDQQMSEGNDAPLLQRIREMVGGRLHTGSMRGPSCVLPINDIRGIEGIGYEKGEKILRCKLAAVYRLVDLFGWTQTGMSGQITARLNTALEQVLTTPRGLLPHEVTASSLVKLDMQGTVHDRGTTNFTVNVDGFSLHAAVHSARPDVRCVLHVRSPATLAVSAMRRGLLPLCHEAAALGELAYHRVPTGILDNDEKDKLVRALGPHAKVLVLSSAGALCCGATLEEAFHQARCLTAACDVQLRLASVPTEELSLLDEETRRQIYESTHKPPSDSAKWRVGGEEFEALMRMLDNAGFRTGYIYRNPLIKNDVPKPKNDVEVPPAVSSLGYLLEEEELYKQGIWKKGHGKTGERTRWLNTPNVYQKVEVLETGTNEPKKITKWIQDGSPAHSGTPVKIDTLQFVPKNTNPKEFKALQQQIKDNRRADKISAGPQSHILEGVTWDEASKLVGEDAINTHTGDHVVLMGAASKGIIQRGYQHNARVYSAPYARNPFDHVSEKELAEYTRRVGARDYDTDLSESEALSAAQVTSPASAHSETEEESRDEHRVLRIETKQAPVRSQPEVVLSDVDTTDFLNAERSHSERTKGTKLTEANPNEAFSTSKRSLHEYSRNAAFDSVVKKFDSPERVVDAPKCKVSLNYGNNFEHNIESNNLGSRSSLSSIPSIEWDGRCRSEYGLRTRSLPRQRVNNSNRLYRTRSHGGFINSYIKDPEPLHYHVPKCRSCGASNVSYAGDVYKDKRSKGCMSMYLSLDNIHQKCVEEKNDKVEVKEMIVPVFKVAKEETEFVESQEFNEEIYLGDIGNSFSSDNMTVIEKCLDSKHDIMIDHNVNGVNDVIIVNDGTNKTQYVNTDIYRAELVTVEENAEVIHNTSLDSVEGEYHSFSEEMDFAEAVYESPVKDLVEKDIRDYSVPIDFYCEDFSKKDDNSPKKSPLKRRDVLKTNQLEPILEESKSSYGDDSCNDSGSKKNSDESTASVVKDIQPKFEDALDDNVSTLISEKENENKDITENLILENTKDSISNGLDTYIQEINIETSDKVVDITAKDVSTKESSINKEDDVTRPSLISIDSSILARKSCEATVEFEKYEIIVDILTTVLNRIDTENANDEFVYIHKPLDIKTHFQIDATEGDGLYVTDAKLDVEMDKDKTNNENSEVNIASLDNLLKEIGVPLHLLPDENQPQNVRYSILDSDAKDNSGDIFCMAEIVKDMERNLNLNETALTESSDTEAIQSQKIVEAVLYYILDRVYFTWANKNKKIKSKQNKTVVTVVDYEDILFTSVPLWLEVDLDNANRTNNNINEDVKDAAQKTIETCLNDDMANYIREDSIAYVNNNVSNNEELVCEDFNHNIVCENNYEVIEEGYNESSVIDVNNNDMEYDINTDEGVSYTMDLNETLDELYEDSSDNLVPYHDIKMIALDIVNSVIENGMLLFEDGEDSLLNINEAEKSLEGSDSYVVSTNMVNENNVAEIINDVTQSINERQRSDVDNFSNETFVLEEHDMNVAFVEDELDTSYFNSRSSSPHKEISAFEICTESPIRMANDTIIVNENLNSLYEKDETILGSPFVKQAPVISMSQTVNSGGIKYWLSFDDSLSNSVTQHKPTYRAIRSYEDSKTPSFVTVKFDKNDANNKYFEYKKDSFKPASVLLDEYNNSGDSLKTDEVYDSAHASNTDYNTCESDVDPKLSESMETPQKMLLYDSRYYLHAKASKRHYTSWPPFEHTLFYRIISRFRMSDSFDPSDLDDTRCDSI